MLPGYNQGGPLGIRRSSSLVMHQVHLCRLPKTFSYMQNAATRKASGSVHRRRHISSSRFNLMAFSRLSKLKTKRPYRSICACNTTRPRFCSEGCRGEGGIGPQESNNFVDIMSIHEVRGACNFGFNSHRTFKSLAIYFRVWTLVNFVPRLT